MKSPQNPAGELALPFPTLHLRRREAESSGEDFEDDRRVGISADGPSRPGLHPQLWEAGRDGPPTSLIDSSLIMFS